MGIPSPFSRLGAALRRLRLRVPGSFGQRLAAGVAVVLVVGIVAVTLATHSPAPPVAATSASASPTPGITPVPTDTASPSPSPINLPTPSPSPTDTPSAPPTATPAPTATPFPATGESAVLIPCGMVPGDSVGRAVVMTPDGQRLLVGGENHINGVGFAYVIDQLPVGWTAEARLTSSAPPTSGFGHSVALSSDGNTALVSAPLSGDGQVYVFSHDSGGWRNSAVLTDGSSSQQRQFGISVSLSADGLTAAVGRLGYSSPGAVYIYRHTTAWSLVTSFSAAVPLANDGFGSTVALAASGTRLMVAAPLAGSVEIYDVAGPSWVKTATMTPSPAPASSLSRATMSADGNTVIAGSGGEYAATSTVYSFVDSGGQWAAQGTLPNHGPANGDFGVALALTADGAKAVVGDYGGLVPQGTASLFTSTGGSWSSQRALTSPSPSQYDLYGASVALSADGSLAAVAAFGMGAQGAVVMFRDPATSAPPQTIVTCS